MDFLLGGMSGVCAGIFSNPFDVKILNLINVNKINVKFNLQ